jgi:hypothetical protein
LWRRRRTADEAAAVWDESSAAIFIDGMMAGVAMFAASAVGLLATQAHLQFRGRKVTQPYARR